MAQKSPRQALTDRDNKRNILPGLGWKPGAHFKTKTVGKLKKL